jgi:hypothetical protein
MERSAARVRIAELLAHVAYEVRQVLDLSDEHDSPGYAPAVIYRYLLPSEKAVITVRRHPVVLSPAAGCVLAAGTFLGLSASGLVGGGGALVAGLSVLLFAACAWFVWAAVRWLDHYFVITRLRLMVIRGFPRSVLLSVFLTQNVADLRYRHFRVPLPWGDVSLGGTFVFTGSDGQRPLKVRCLPYPDQLYLEVYHLAFPHLPYRDELDRDE